MFLGILAVIALTAGTIQSAAELEYIDAVTPGSNESAVAQVIETDSSLHQSPDFMDL